jgi:Pyruvate/2-oxoglutarate dehydrogenase complex, dihydrolipoamide acyltransferase (E2) component, and related enzymes
MKCLLRDIERNIGKLGEKAREGKITIDDLQGGTFTITNGGIYGSMLSTHNFKSTSISCFRNA